MRESTIEQAVVTYARMRGCLVIKNATPGHRGVPDRLFLKSGKVMFLEFKAPGKKPSAIQMRWLRDLYYEGFPAFDCDDVEQGKRLIDLNLL
jgi:Holliday junction resolvase